MRSTLLWVLLGLAAAGLVVGAVWLLDAPAPRAVSPAPVGNSTHGMSPSEMCAHMPEHCGNATAEGPP